MKIQGRGVTRTRQFCTEYMGVCMRNDASSDASKQHDEFFTAKCCDERDWVVSNCLVNGTWICLDEYRSVYKPTGIGFTHDNAEKLVILSKARGSTAFGSKKLANLCLIMPSSRKSLSGCCD